MVGSPLPGLSFLGRGSSPVSCGGGAAMVPAEFFGTATFEGENAASELHKIISIITVDGR